MESIEYFFRRMFDRIVNKLFYQLKYKITDFTNSKIREAVEKPFNQRVKNNRPPTNIQEQNNKH